MWPPGCGLPAAVWSPFACGRSGETLRDSTAQFDVAIIGGGPAGTSAAITAARLGARVALLEAKPFPRHKVCGEFVSAEALGLLRSLAEPVPAAAEVFQHAWRIERARLFSDGRKIETAIRPPALSLARYELDALLWEAAKRAGVERFPNCEVLGVDGAGPFIIRATGVAEPNRASSGPATQDHAASAGGGAGFVVRAVIVAAGRWSNFTADRSQSSGPKWLGLKAHFQERNPAPSTDLYFFEHGYCGVQPVAANVVNVCAMVRSDRATTLQQVFELHPTLAERGAKWSALFPSLTTAPLLFREPQPARNKMLFAGDAAAFIDPFVGDGISIALRSGKLAAEGVCEFLRGSASLEQAVGIYAQEYSHQFAPLLAAAARVRSLLELPALPRYLAFQLARLPGVMQYVLRKTRRASS